MVERPLLLTILTDVALHLCALPRRQPQGAACIDGSATGSCAEGCGTQRYCRGRAAAAPRHSGLSVRPWRARHATASTTTTSTQSLRRSACSATRRTGLRLGAVRRARLGDVSRRAAGGRLSEHGRGARAPSYLAATLRHLPDEARAASELLDCSRGTAATCTASPAAEASVAGASFAGFFHLFNHSCSPTWSSTLPAGSPPRPTAPLLLLWPFDVASGEELCHDEQRRGKRAQR